ncbi:hypothetical protein [Mycolicibacterium lutetiense]|uniref:DUF222 domain-containing protein n=1 Tax=Mycolicibacterium lutetiense TaxID=1641992 RepID=A0ABS5A3Y0_9MYCO|nr:hypothetical protein [Mycolicibacterium lutetiense]MBP2456161.1 hypothetical protein [Mycolicibacterium lutetiense]
MVLERMIDRKEAATALAVEVLDELRVSVLECLLALDAIGQETIIDFEPLTESLVASGGVARQAFIAASLLNQDAEFAPLCRESNCTTPSSIINRHLAAVADGAPATLPDRSDVDDFETEIGGPFAWNEGPMGTAQYPHLSLARVMGPPDCQGDGTTVARYRGCSSGSSGSSWPGRVRWR